MPCSFSGTLVRKSQPLRRQSLGTGVPSEPHGEDQHTIYIGASVKISKWRINTFVSFPVSSSAISGLARVSWKEDSHLPKHCLNHSLDMAVPRLPSRDSLKSKTADEFIEEAPAADPWLDEFPLIKEKSVDELNALNHAVVKKLDWKFLPCVTMMLLMK